MSKIKVGDACAFIPGGIGGKNRYHKMGVCYKDTETGYLSFKIDTLPLQGAGWLGWINVFPDKEKTPGQVDNRKADGSLKTTREIAAEMDDDVPF